jgi:hypothetical protein
MTSSIGLADRLEVTRTAFPVPAKDRAVAKHLLDLIGADSMPRRMSLVVLIPFDVRDFKQHLASSV